MKPSPPGPAAGRLLLVVAALLWSTTGLFVKSGPLRELSGVDLACLRALFATGWLVPLLRRRHVRWRAGLVPLVLSFAAMNVLFLGAMTWTTAGSAVFLQYTATAWAFVLGLLLLKERGETGSLVAVGCALAGIAWIVGHEPPGQGVAGTWLALASGAAFGGVIVALRGLRELSAVWLVLVCQSVSCLVLLPRVLVDPPPLDLTQWLLLALFGGLQMSLPYLLFARGIRSVPAREAALIVLLEPLLTPIWVMLLGWETTPLATWVGGGLILGGLMLRYLLFPLRASERD